MIPTHEYFKVTDRFVSRRGYENVTGEVLTDYPWAQQDWDAARAAMRQDGWTLAAGPIKLPDRWLGKFMRALR